MLRTLDLFSGIGGFSLGLERTGGFKTVAFCEIEEYPRKVLAKHWPDVPIHEDIRTLKGADIGTADVICGGYPCQPFSVAGNRAGAEDDRHLWPEMHRLVDELRPTWVIGENVAGHLTMGLDQVLSDLEGSGYACRTFVIPACAVDAPHRRERVWIVAHAPRGGKRARAQSPATAWRRPGDGSEDVAHTDEPRLEERQETGNTESERTQRNQFSQRRSDSAGPAWLPEPDVGRVAHGVSKRVDRLRALGNAVVPQVVKMIGQMILAVMANEENNRRE